MAVRRFQLLTFGQHGRVVHGVLGVPWVAEVAAGTGAARECRSRNH